MAEPSNTWVKLDKAEVVGWWLSAGGCRDRAAERAHHYEVDRPPKRHGRHDTARTAR